MGQIRIVTRQKTNSTHIILPKRKPGPDPCLNLRRSKHPARTRSMLPSRYAKGMVGTRPNTQEPSLGLGRHLVSVGCLAGLCIPASA